MRGKDIARSRCIQGAGKSAPEIVHMAMNTGKNGEGGMSLVEMANIDGHTQLPQQLPTANTQTDFLLQAHLWSAPVELGGDATIGRTIERVVTIQQIEGDPSNLGLPSAQNYRTSGEGELQTQPLPIGVANRLDRQLRWIVVGI